MQQQTMQEMSLETFTDTFPMFTNRKLRIDTKSQMISVIDVIQMVSCINQCAASKVLQRLEEKFKSDSNHGTNFRSKCLKVRIDGKGKPTPVADAATMIEIIWELPGKMAASFRRESAHYVARILGGDRTLIDEIEMRYDRTPADQKEFMTANVERVVLPRRGAKELELVRKRKLEDLDIANQELALEERKCALQQRKCALQKLTLEIPDMVTTLHLEVCNTQRKELEAMGMLDSRAKLTISDSIKNFDPMSDPGAQQIYNAKKELWTVSEIVERHMKHILTAYNKHNSQVGMLVAAGYRKKYNKDNEQKSNQICNNRVCFVNAYSEDDFCWILRILARWETSLADKIYAQEILEQG